MIWDYKLNQVYIRLNCLWLKIVNFWKKKQINTKIKKIKIEIRLFLPGLGSRNRKEQVPF